MEFRNGLEDRDRHRALEDKDSPLAKEDRAWRLQLQDEDRSFVRENRALAKEDRQRRIAAENQSQAFTNEQHDRRHRYGPDLLRRECEGEQGADHGDLKAVLSLAKGLPAYDRKGEVMGREGRGVRQGAA